MSLGPTVLAVKNLETWYGPVNAIKGVNLDVQAGDIVAVLGANGAGKTTLLNTIAGVIDPFKGRSNSRASRSRARTRTASHAAAGAGARRPPGVSLPVGAREPDHGHLRAPPVATTSRPTCNACSAGSPVCSSARTSTAACCRAASSRCWPSDAHLMARPTVLLLDEPSLGLSPLLTQEIFAIIKTHQHRAGHLDPGGRAERRDRAGRPPTTATSWNWAVSWPPAPAPNSWPRTTSRSSIWEGPATPTAAGQQTALETAQDLEVAPWQTPPPPPQAYGHDTPQAVPCPVPGLGAQPALRHKQKASGRRRHGPVITTMPAPSAWPWPISACSAAMRSRSCPRTGRSGCMRTWAPSAWVS
jgi:branched-chain amino acid transport system ATP-binding protein